MALFVNSLRLRQSSALVFALLLGGLSPWGLARAQATAREACTDILNIVDSANANASMKPGSLNWNEPLDQSNSGVCHSMVAAEMLTQVLGDQISPASIAYTYKEERSFLMKLGEIANREATRPDYFTGSIGGALNSALRHGVCREESFPLWQLWGRLREPEASIGPAKTLAEICNSAPQRPREWNWTLISMQSRLEDQSSGTPSLQGIDDVLNSGRIVGIDHNVWSLLNPERQSKTPRLLGVLPVAGHSASLVGRRWHNGRCQYLYRNSWGRACHQYRQDLSCDRGHVWLDEAEVLRITMYAYAIIPAQP